MFSFDSSYRPPTPAELKALEEFAEEYAKNEFAATYERARAHYQADVDFLRSMNITPYITPE